MAEVQPGARWEQLRSRVLSTPEGQRSYAAGARQAQSYREAMRILDGVRRARGISQSELARRLEKKQPTIARMLAHGENPTLETLSAVLEALGLHGRLVIEAADPEDPSPALVVEVEDAGAGQTIWS